MPDMEKVVKGLQCCSGTGDCVNSCPYGDVTSFMFECTSLLAQDALELLKEQDARIRELEEKLRVLEYGDQNTLKSAMMPAT